MASVPAANIYGVCRARAPSSEDVSAREGLCLQLTFEEGRALTVLRSSGDRALVGLK